MTRHPSVPDNQTGWVRLGVVTTDTALLAIVGPEMAGVLSDTWLPRYIGEDGEPLERPPGQLPPEHESVEFEELELGDEGDRAVLLDVHADGGYIIEGRFGDVYGEGHMTLLEVRIRIWGCCCTCHDSDSDGGARCDGDCHDEDPS
jgi:hypothetical protein